jgi:hypothetical protein
MRRLLLLCVLAALVAPPAAQADAVIDWSVNAQNAIFATAPTPHASTLSFAMVQGAVYDAVNSIDHRYEPYLDVPRAPRHSSQDAAAATAAFRVLAALYPPQLDTLQAEYDASLAGVPDGRAKARGIAAGEAAAAAMLAARANDGRLPAGTPYPFPLGTLPGEWRVSPPLTTPDPAWWLANVRPFMLPRADMVRTDGPNPLWSRGYARDVNEVKRIGAFDSTVRTPDQTTAAIFWQAQPLLLYEGVLRDLSARKHLTTAQNARLFAMVTLAAADGAIGCWNDKYFWRFWRPIEAIRTTTDPTWRPLFDPATATTPTLATPNFPDHPSGHSCLSSAVVHTLQDFFGTDRIGVDIVSPRFPGQPRRFQRLSDVLDEIIEARVWGGIHFRTADEQGAELGRKVARFERRHYFQRVE